METFVDCLPGSHEARYCPDAGTCGDRNYCYSEDPISLVDYAQSDKQG